MAQNSELLNAEARSKALAELDSIKNAMQHWFKSTHSLWDADDSERTIRESFYQATGIISEMHQRLNGGFWSTEYIQEKAQKISRWAEDVKN